MRKNDKGKEIGHLNMAKPRRSFETIKANREDYKDEMDIVYRQYGHIMMKKCMSGL